MHRTISQWHETFSCQKHPVYNTYSPTRPKFWSLSLYDQPLSRYKIVGNRNYTEWSQNDIEHLIYWSVSLYKQLFSRNNIGKNWENRKCTTWPQNDIKHLSFKSTMYMLSTPSPPHTHTYTHTGPNFGPFHNATCHFQDTWLSKNNKNAERISAWYWTVKCSRSGWSLFGVFVIFLANRVLWLGQLSWFTQNFFSKEFCNSVQY